MFINPTQQHVNTKLNSITADNVNTVKNTPLNNLAVSLYSNGTTKNVDYYQINTPKSRFLSRLLSEKKASSEMRIAFDATLNDSVNIEAGEKYVGGVNLKYLDNKRRTPKGQANVRIIVAIQSHDKTTHTLNYKIDIPGRSTTFTRYRSSRKHLCDFDKGSVRFTNLWEKRAVSAKHYGDRYQSNSILVKAKNPIQRPLETGQPLTMNPARTKLSIPTVDGDDFFFDTYSRAEDIPQASQNGEATPIDEKIANPVTQATQIMTSAYSMTNHAAYYLGQTLISAIGNTYHTLTDPMTSVHRYVVKPPESEPEFHIEDETEDDDITVLHSNRSSTNQSTYITDAIEFAGHFFANALSIAGNIYQKTTTTATSVMASASDIVEDMADTIGTGLDRYEAYGTSHY